MECQSPCVTAWASGPARAGGSSGNCHRRMRALLQERQDRRKAELDAHRRDVQFAVGGEVLLDTEHTPLPSRSLLSKDQENLRIGSS